MNSVVARRLAIGGSAAAVVGAHAGVAAFFAARNPYEQTIFPKCIFLHLTGWQCPGCGGTRALYSAFELDLATSLAMNPIVVTGYASLALIGGSVIADRVRKPRLARGLRLVTIVVVVATVVYTAVIRNLIP